MEEKKKWIKDELKDTIVTVGLAALAASGAIMLSAASMAVGSLKTHASWRATLSACYLEDPTLKDHIESVAQKVADSMKK